MELERWKDLRGVPLGTYEGVGCRVAEFEGLIENKLLWAKRRGIAVMLKVIWGFYGTQLMLKSSNAVLVPVVSPRVCRQSLKYQSVHAEDVTGEGR